MKDIEKYVKDQNQSYKSGRLRSYNQRIEILDKLFGVINSSRADIKKALAEDLGKSKFESYISEVGFILSEIKHTKKKLKKWMRLKKVGSPLVYFPVKSEIHYEAFGSVLIIGPWNYPFQLIISPLIGAIAAGNTAVLKPSELAPSTSRVIKELIDKTFDSSVIAVVEGGVEETQFLLDQKFDYIFYTGGETVGKIVMEKASKHLTPVTLELGGKSPCFVFGEVDFDITAKRIVWGKLFNTGQTCVAPDYLIIDKSISEKLVNKIEEYIIKFYGKSPEKNNDYGSIINERHFDRITSLIDKELVLIGGSSNKETLYIEPTVQKATASSLIMQQEIFGPVLPIIEVENLKEALDFVVDRPKPLATYVFSKDKKIQNAVIENISSGGICINDTLIHLDNDELPFGGVGTSGMGSYHGQHSFELFSHKKAVMRRSFKFENSLRYPPYFGKLKIVKFLLSLIGR